MEDTSESVLFDAGSEPLNQPAFFADTFGWFSSEGEEVDFTNMTIGATEGADAPTFIFDQAGLPHENVDLPGFVSGPLDSFESQIHQPQIIYDDVFCGQMPPLGYPLHGHQQDALQYYSVPHKEELLGNVQPDLDDPSDQQVFQPQTNPMSKTLNRARETSVSNTASIDEAFRRAKLVFNTDLQGVERRPADSGMFSSFKVEPKEPKRKRLMTASQRQDRRKVREQRACMYCKLRHRKCSISGECLKMLEWTRSKKDLGFTTSIRDPPTKFNPFMISQDRLEIADTALHLDAVSILCYIFNAATKNKQDGAGVVVNMVYYSHSLYLLADRDSTGSWADHLGQKAEASQMLSQSSNYLLNALEASMNALRRVKTPLQLNTMLNLITLLYAHCQDSATLKISGILEPAAEMLSKYLLMCLEWVLPEIYSKDTIQELHRIADTYMADLDGPNLGKIASLIVTRATGITPGPRSMVQILQDAFVGFEELVISRMSDPNDIPWAEYGLRFPWLDPTNDVHTRVKSKTLAVWSLLWISVPKFVQEMGRYTSENYMQTWRQIGYPTIEDSPNQEFRAYTWQDWDLLALRLRRLLFLMLKHAATYFTGSKANELRIILSFIPLQMNLSVPVGLGQISEELQSCFRWWMIYILSDIGLVDKSLIDLFTYNVLRSSREMDQQWHTGWFLAERAWKAFKSIDALAASSFEASTREWNSAGVRLNESEAEQFEFEFELDSSTSKDEAELDELRELFLADSTIFARPRSFQELICVGIQLLERPTNIPQELILKQAEHFWTQLGVRMQMLVVKNYLDHMRTYETVRRYFHILSGEAENNNLQSKSHAVTALTRFRRHDSRNAVQVQRRGNTIGVSIKL